MEKKSVSVVGTVGVPACYGGFESLVENLLDYTPENIEYTVFCSKRNYHEYLDIYKGAKLKYLSLSANGVQSILYDIRSMWLGRKSDIILVLGVSGGMFLPFLRLFSNAKIITNIDGQEWKRDKWNCVARILLKKSEKSAVKYSDFVIGDNKGIIDYVKTEYKKDAILITYGSDNAKKVNKEIFLTEFPFLAKPYAVAVCRIEPENNIHLFLQAFEKKSDIPLVVVGNWNNSVYGISLKEKYNNHPSIKLLDPIYENQKINCIRSNASLYIHGHSAGGTNPSLVEAMNLGLPVFAYDCIFNRATTYGNAFYWKNSFDLIKILSSTSEEELQECGKRMKALAQDFYTWKFIADKYNDLYKD